MIDPSTLNLIQRLTDALAEATKPSRAPTVAFLLGQARSLLSAVSEAGEAPTRKELVKLAKEHDGWVQNGFLVLPNPEEFVNAALSLWCCSTVSQGGGPTDEEIDKLEQSMWDTTGVTEQLQQEQVFNYREFLRKGLSLWGNPTPTPLLERGPRPEECDSDGRCWCYSPRIDIPDPDLNMLVFHERWILTRPGEIDTHWLPYWALPHQND